MVGRCGQGKVVYGGVLQTYVQNPMEGGREGEGGRKGGGREGEGGRGREGGGGREGEGGRGREGEGGREFENKIV